MEITVKWSGISNASTQFYGFASDVGNYAASIRSITNNLKIPNKVKYQIKYSINAKCDSLNNVQKKLRAMGSVLNQAQHQYKSTENQIVSSGKATSIVIPQASINMPASLKKLFTNLGLTNSHSIDAIWKKLNRFNPNMLGTLVGVGGVLGKGTASFMNTVKHSTTLSNKIQGSLVNGSKTINGNVLGFSSSGTASGDLIGGSLKTEFTSSLTSINAKVAGEGHLAQGKVEGNIGLFSGSATGTVGQVEGSGKLGISLIKDGKISPTIEAELKASATGAKGSVNAAFGTQKYNVHADASGKILNANAQASGAIGVIRSKGENGQERVEFGAKGSVGAEAYLAQGKVSGGFTLFGIKVNVGAEGKAGGAGIKAGGKVTTGGISGKIDLGLGLGAGLEIGIDWSGFKLF